MSPPLCTPACGLDAHCEYGEPNRCICNTGHSGNPYISCAPQNKNVDCLHVTCGINGECRQGLNRVDCVCPVGYKGNPYIECQDVDECIGNSCGMNAICINTPGSFDCQCQAGFSGNPFMMCMPIDVHVDPCIQTPSLCGCASNSDCRTGMTCKNKQCQDACKDVLCGPNAACNNGECQCSPGFSGNPNNLQNGCQPPSGCRNDLECDSDEICFSNRGHRRCVNACEKVQCGPNSICVAQNHRSSCLCKDGYYSIPNDSFGGCQVESKESECGRNADCASALTCQIDHLGVMRCVDPCLSLVCGQNELCSSETGQTFCKCKDGYIRNPLTEECQSKLQSLYNSNSMLTCMFSYYLKL